VTEAPRGGRGYAIFARMFGSAVTSQALLSAASLIIGLVLIRRASDHQYGYYVLGSSALILLASLQNAFFNPPLSVRLPRLDSAARAALVGGLYREQRRIAGTLALVAGGIAAVLWAAGVLDAQTGPIVLVTILAAVVVLNREFFRMVLFAYRHASDVLRADALQVAVLVFGVFLATTTAAPAAGAILTIGVAAAVSAVLLVRAAKRVESWQLHARPEILREIAPLAAWSTFGAAIHWTFSQGYSWLVAGTLDLAAVAAIAATRLTVMPLNLLSTGIGQLMLPLVSRWLHDHGPMWVLRRVILFAAGMVAASLCYIAALWLLRDWIFSSVLHKEVAQRDALLMLWSATFVVMVVRDQLLYFLAARELFRRLTSLVLLSAVSALLMSYVAMQHIGAPGAPLGVLVGETINLCGIVTLSFCEARRRYAAPSLAASES
jgi:O-antigen/teichoic acid export membrane protein